MPSEHATRMSEVTLRRLQTRLDEVQEKKKKIMGGLDGADFTSALHDDPNMARESQFIDNAIAQLTGLLFETDIIPLAENAEKVKLGARVTLKFQDDPDPETYVIGTTIDSQFAVEGENWLSDETPLGKAIMGKIVNDQVEIKIGSEIQKVKILAVL